MVTDNQRMQEAFHQILFQGQPVPNCALNGSPIDEFVLDRLFDYDDNPYDYELSEQYQVREEIAWNLDEDDRIFGMLSSCQSTGLHSDRYQKVKKEKTTSRKSWNQNRTRDHRVGYINRGKTYHGGQKTVYRFVSDDEIFFWDHEYTWDQENNARDMPDELDSIPFTDGYTTDGGWFYEQLCKSHEARTAWEHDLLDWYETESRDDWGNRIDSADDELSYLLANDPDPYDDWCDWYQYDSQEGSYR